MIVKTVKKPVTIEAVQWTGDNFDEIKEFCDVIDKGNYLLIPVAYLTNELTQDNLSCKHNKIEGTLYIRTLEGDHRAIIGDYIIKGVRGECYPIKSSIFKETYNIVN